MKRNIKQDIQNIKLPFLRTLLVLGLFNIVVSCEVDDMPPPSAWVAPEPVEGCVQVVGVPEISEGIIFECEYPETTVFGEKDGSLTVEPADNPDKEGINTSDKVIMVTQTAGVEGWAGFSFVLASKVDFSEKQTIKIKVYSPAEGQTILLKLEDKTDSTINKEVPATTTVANEWEELSFVFSPGDSDKFDRMVLFFNFNGDKDATTVHYFDDIVQVEGGSTEEPGGSSDPTSAPPSPTAAAADVLSIFSDSYTDPAGVNYNPNWGQSTTFEIVDLAGNEVIKYGNVNYEGIEFGETLDLSSYNTLNIDVWSQDYTAIQIFLISPGPVEKSVTLNVTPTGWNTIEVPLEDFTSQGLDISAIFQIKFVVETAGGDFYIDNLYFSNDTDGGGPAATFALPVNFDDTVDYASKSSGVSFEVVVNPKKSGINSTDTKVGAVTNNGDAYEALTFALDDAIDFSGSNKTITMKVYSETAYPVLFKLETGVNGERANEVEVNHGGTGWEELTFNFNNARKSYVDGDPENGAAFVPTGQYDTFSIFLDFAGTTAGTFYIDDIKQN